MVQKASRAEGYPRPLSTPPAIALLRSAYAIRRRIWGWVEGVRGKRRTRQTHLSYLGPRNGQDFRGGAECGGRRPRGAAKKEEEEGVEGGGRRDHRKPFPPHGLEGACDGWDEGEESRGLFSPWEPAWGESTRGHLNGVLSYLSPRTTKVRAEVGEDGASVCGDWVVA